MEFGLGGGVDVDEAEECAADHAEDVAFGLADEKHVGSCAAAKDGLGMMADAHGFADPEGAGDFGGEPVLVLDDLFVELVGGEPTIEFCEFEKLTVLGEFAGAVALEDDDRVFALVICGLDLLMNVVHGVATGFEGYISDLSELVLAFASEFGVVNNTARSIEEFDGIGVSFGEDDVGGGLVHLHGHSQWDEAVDAVIDVVDV